MRDMLLFRRPAQRGSLCALSASGRSRRVRAVRTLGRTRRWRFQSPPSFGISIGAAVILFLVGCEDPVDPNRPEPEESQTGSIIVTSAPEGARVFFDGRDTGQVTPYTIPEVAGYHTVRLTLAGHSDWGPKSVFVTGGQTASIVAALEPLEPEPQPPDSPPPVNPPERGRVAVINPDAYRTLKAGYLTTYGGDDINPIPVTYYWSLAHGNCKDAALLERPDWDTREPCLSGVGTQSDFIGQLLSTNGYDVTYYTSVDMPAIGAEDYAIVVVQDPLKTNIRQFTKETMDASVPDLLEHVLSSQFRTRISNYHKAGGTLLLVGDAVRLLESNRLGAQKTVSQHSVPHTVSKADTARLPDKWLFVRGNPFCGVDRKGSGTYTASSSSLVSSGSVVANLSLFNGNDLFGYVWSDTVYKPDDATSLLDVRVAGSSDYVLRGDVCRPPVHSVRVNDTVYGFMGYTSWNRRKVFYVGSDSFFDYRFRNFHGTWHAGQYAEIDFDVTSTGNKAILELVKRALAE